MSLKVTFVCQILTIQKIASNSLKGISQIEFKTQSFFGFLK